jgi:protein-disulfide isomerase
MSFSFESIATIAVTVAAIAVGAATYHREFGAAGRDSNSNALPPTYVPAWRDLANHGIVIGSTAAPIEIVEFADFECPFCRRFSAAVSELERERPGEVAVVFIHYPIQKHRFARPAARAAECANAQGDFSAFQQLLFSKQDSFGLKPWTSFAREAGLSDTTRFRRCTEDTSVVPRVEDGLVLGRKLAVTGTPTVIINGWRFPAPPYDSLPQIADRLVRGLDPQGHRVANRSR